MDGGNANAEINLHTEWIAPATIVKTFEKHSVPKELDLLSIDIDSTDLWIWRALGEAGYRPRVLIIEYNRNWGLGDFKTFPDTSGHFPGAGSKDTEWQGDCVMQGR